VRINGQNLRSESSGRHTKPQGEHAKVKLFYIVTRKGESL